MNKHKDEFKTVLDKAKKNMKIGHEEKKAKLSFLSICIHTYDMWIYKVNVLSFNTVKSRFYRPFADDQVLNKIEISLY